MRLLLLLLVGFSSILALASETPAPQEVHLNPGSLRTLLLSGSLSITQAMNQVHDAKDQFRLSRAKLLPSLNLGGLLSPNGPTFILSQLDFSLPFLVPSNWINAHQSHEVFEAQKIAFQVQELNAYSSSLSVYFTAVADEEISEIYTRQAGDLDHIYDIQSKLFKNERVGSPEDVAHALAQAQVAMLQASQLSELSQGEIATLRKTLGLPLSAVLKLDDASMNPSEWESAPAESVAKLAYSRAPEREQIQHLVNASNDGYWSQAFGFVSGASVSSQAIFANGGINPAGLSNLTARGTLSLGFTLIPALDLSSRNTEEVKLQLTDLDQETSRLVETALASIKEAENQLQLAQSAEANLEQVYKSKDKQYKMGVGQLLDALLARGELAQAQIFRIKAELDLNLLRTALHRALLTDEFAKIQGCNSSVQPKEKETGFVAWVKGIFGSEDESHSTLDELCRPKSTTTD